MNHPVQGTLLQQLGDMKSLRRPRGLPVALPSTRPLLSHSGPALASSWGSWPGLTRQWRHPGSAPSLLLPETKLQAPRSPTLYSHRPGGGARRGGAQCCSEWPTAPPVLLPPVQRAAAQLCLSEAPARPHASRRPQSSPSPHVHWKSGISRVAGSLTLCQWFVHYKKWFSGYFLML